jgi:hypothetical protein
MDPTMEDVSLTTIVESASHREEDPQFEQLVVRILDKTEKLEATAALNPSRRQEVMRTLVVTRWVDVSAVEVFASSHAVFDMTHEGRGSWYLNSERIRLWGVGYVPTSQIVQSSSISIHSGHTIQAAMGLRMVRKARSKASASRLFRGSVFVGKAMICGSRRLPTTKVAKEFHGLRLVVNSTNRKALGELLKIDEENRKSNVEREEAKRKKKGNL